MKHGFRIMIGMLLFAIPLCLNAQIKPTKPNNEGEKPKSEKAEPKLQMQSKPQAQPETPVKPEKPEKPEHKGGFEMPKISGFVQGMYQANLSDKGDLLDNNFSMRRVRLSVEGTFVKGLTYKIQGDFSRKPMLVDAYLKYKPCNEFAIQIGQFKTPFTIESPINPVNLEIFDYGEAIQGLVGYKDVCGVGSLGRDLGIMATGSLFPVEGAEGTKYHVVDYSLGVFNGNGANEKDNNNHKDLVGRLDIHPGLKALTLSGSYYYGKYYKDEENNGTRNRWSAGAQYNDGKLVLRGEYIGGKTGYVPTNIPEDLGYFNSNGYYAQAGYYFGLGKEKSQKLMPVLRYEHFNTNTALVNGGGGTNWYTAGLNYWPLKSVNLKLDYSLVEKVLGEKAYSHRLVAMVNYKF